MLKDIVEVKPLGDYRLYLRFEDGVAGEVDFAGRLRFEGVFAPLRDPAVFAQVRIHPELGTVAWPRSGSRCPLCRAFWDRDRGATSSDPQNTLDRSSVDHHSVRSSVRRWALRRSSGRVPGSVL